MPTGYKMRSESRKNHPDHFDRVQELIQQSFPDSRTPAFLVLPDGELVTDNFCYSIRSYVVARDEKDSDSTHLVKSSTCTPARRFHVRKADDQQKSPNR